MKLLPSKELNTKLNEQKKSEIDAGLFLAKKVDALREELSETQIAHDIAMQGMKDEYAKLVGEYTAKKGSLEVEITYLEAKRDELLVPLDAEWEKIHELTKKINEQICILEEKEHEYKQRETTISRKERETEIKKVRTENSLSEAEKIKEKAKELLILRETQLALSEKERVEFVQQRRNLLLSIEDKERRLAYDIKHYKDFTARLKQKEKELNLRETRVAIKENAKHD